MSWSWQIYTPRSRDELDRIVESYEEALGRHLEEGDIDEDSELGVVMPGGPVPTSASLSKKPTRFSRRLTPEILDRLETCKASLLIEDPGIPEVDPLQASALCYLLDRMGPGLVDWGEFDMETTEDVLARMKELPDYRPMGGEAGEDEEVTPAGVKESMHILEELERIARSQELRIDFERSVRRLPEMAQHYLALLYSQGAHGDDAAARKLDVDIEDIVGYRERILDLM
jgi:hypothetical protein